MFFLKSFESFLVFITQQNDANAELDKTELLMSLKNRTLSTEIEYYQEIRNIKKKTLIRNLETILMKLYW